MTAVVSFKSADTAYLATDTAHIRTDGTIHSFAPKALAWPTHRIAIAAQGFSDALPLMLQKTPEWNKPVNQAGILAAVPDALRCARHWARQSMPEREPTGLNEVHLWLALFCAADQRPKLLTVATGPMESMPDLQPYTLTEHDGLASPAVDMTAVIPTGWRGSADQAAARILEAQRRGASAFIPGANIVGGEGELWTIDADGIDREIVIRWPEKVGERCNPRLAGKMAA